ncbi:MAG: anaphase-promoting complex subunit cdc27 [Watsoniomyces obsoletus]|nr:MAG: anaphase-promoting complex subunit cdc27 [Watsoniomyces obsoletus]
MSPPNSLILTQLRNLIYYHLDNHHLQNALFVAGRLHALEPRNPDTVHLLALCHLRLGQHKLAYEYSKAHAIKGGHLGCAYVFAESCLALGHGREKEGVAALDKNRSLWRGRNHLKILSKDKHTETSRQPLPDAASVYCLMGKLWYAYGFLDQAIECYVEAVKMNPFMWDAFLGICQSGVHVRTANIFKMTPELLATLSTGSDASEVTENLPNGPMSSTATGPLQSQHHNHHPTPSMADPFSLSANRPNGGEGGFTIGGRIINRHGEIRVADVAHAASVSASLLGEDISVGIIDTPTAPGAAAAAASIDADSMMGTDMNRGGLTFPPPVSTLRGHAIRNRPVAGFGTDISGLELPAPGKAPSTRARSRIGSEVEDLSDGITITRAAVPAAAGDRKRTVSGHPTQTSSSQASESMAAPQRRSVRLFNQIRPSSNKLTAGSHLGFRDAREVKRAARTSSRRVRTGEQGSTVGRVVSGNRKPTDPMDIDAKEGQQQSIPTTTTNGHVGGSPTKAQPAATQAQAEMQAPDPAKQQEALKYLLDVFAFLGSAYYALSHLRCDDALAMFEALPAAHRETPWVLAQIGRTLYEKANYVEAEKRFKKVRALSPARLEDMEIYSTVLWHLKNEVGLSFLAHELMDVDRLSPQAWCAIGNTFSLQRDHDQALKCFKRATQVDPRFAYAFTLQGHEHVSNEEYDKAMTAYRSAVQVDNRHYNAWYGLGLVFEKLGQYELAQNHFMIAMRINPTNPVLICCLGVILEKNKKPQSALHQYTNACELAPRSALPRYRRARVLVEMGDLKQALKELKVCNDIAPDEANVHFWLGKVYKELKHRQEAVKHFTIALNLDPKAGQYIRSAMEQMENEHEDIEDVDDWRLDD